MRSALEDTWVDVTALRTGLVDLLVGLPDDVAHVLLPPRTSLLALPGLVRARFDVARYVHDDAVRRAEAPVPALLAAFRHAVDRRWLPPTRRPEHLLADLYIHTQDIRRPLGLPAPCDAGSLRTVLVTVVADRVIGDPARTVGLRLVATDLDWAHGDGPEVAGTADALVLTLSGRRVALPELAGPGVATLAARLP